MSVLKIESDLNVGDTVYIGHKCNEIKEIKTKTYINVYECKKTEIFYIAQDGEIYTRKEIKSVSEYKTELIELANSLDDINN